MNGLKKLTAVGMSIAALLTVVPAKAWVSVNRNPISNWIVLNGLFGGVNAYGTGNGGVVSGPNGTIATNGNGSGVIVRRDPVGQWLVLNSLFNGYGFGGLGGSYLGSPFGGYYSGSPFSSYYYGSPFRGLF